MANKLIYIEFPNGDVYRMPAWPVVKHRADYYAGLDTKDGADYEQIYNEEFRFAMESDFEITDWIANSMKWNDIASHAVYSHNRFKVEPSDMWNEAEFSVKEE